MRTIIRKGYPAPEFTTTDVRGHEVSVRSLHGRKVLLAFQRNVACPFCNYRVFQLNKKVHEWKEKGLEVVVFFESKKEIILRSSFLKDLHLSVVSDTERVIYTQYGVEKSFLKMAATQLSAQRSQDRKAVEALGFTGQPDPGKDDRTIPADFLLDEGGIVQVAHYGKDLGDNLSFENIEEFISRKS